MTVMEAYKIVAGSFEGPLDLLVHLIEKDQLDIYDIPIASVTEQYLAYIGGMQEFNIELASEFLLMAATLLQIKSRMLLPKKPLENLDIGDVEECDPRRQLVERLIAYRQFKALGEALAALWEKNALYAVRPPMTFAVNTANFPKNLTVEKLLMAISGLLQTDEEIITYINDEEIHVQDKITDILHLLNIKGNRLTLKATLIRSGSVTELVASFLAVLELLRLRVIKIRQPEKFGEIYLYLREETHVL